MQNDLGGFGGLGVQHDGVGVGAHRLGQGDAGLGDGDAAGVVVRDGADGLAVDDVLAGQPHQEGLSRALVDLVLLGVHRDGLGLVAVVEDDVAVLPDVVGVVGGVVAGGMECLPVHPPLGVEADGAGDGEGEGLALLSRGVADDEVGRAVVVGDDHLDGVDDEAVVVAADDGVGDGGLAAPAGVDGVIVNPGDGESAHGGVGEFARVPRNRVGVLRGPRRIARLDRSLEELGHGGVADGRLHGEGIARGGGDVDPVVGETAALVGRPVARLRHGDLRGRNDDLPGVVVDDGAVGPEPGGVERRAPAGIVQLEDEGLIGALVNPVVDRETHGALVLSREEDQVVRETTGEVLRDIRAVAALTGVSLDPPFDRHRLIAGALAHNGEDDALPLLRPGVGLDGQDRRAVVVFDGDGDVVDRHRAVAVYIVAYRRLALVVGVVDVVVLGDHSHGFRRPVVGREGQRGVRAQSLVLHVVLYHRDLCGCHVPDREEDEPVLDGGLLEGDGVGAVGIGPRRLLELEGSRLDDGYVVVGDVDCDG